MILLSNASKKMYASNRLLHCVVLFEPRRPTKDIPQCRNCLRFSHTKKICHLPFRCVKCVGDLHFSKCVKEKVTPQNVSTVPIITKLITEGAVIRKNYQNQKKKCFLQKHEQIIKPLLNQIDNIYRSHGT